MRYTLRSIITLFVLISILVFLVGFRLGRKVDELNRDAALSPFPALSPTPTPMPLISITLTPSPKLKRPVVLTPAPTLTRTLSVPTSSVISPQ